jgi:hypothetical protein
MTYTGIWRIQGYATTKLFKNGIYRNMEHKLYHYHFSNEYIGIWRTRLRHSLIYPFFFSSQAYVNLNSYKNFYYDHGIKLVNSWKITYSIACLDFFINSRFKLIYDFLGLQNPQRVFIDLILTVLARLS